MEKMVTIRLAEYESLKQKTSGWSNRNSFRTKVGSEKMSGNQKDHPGHHLSMVKIPNKIVEHIPQMSSYKKIYIHINATISRFTQKNPR
ncbi:MAG: hypothetical protein LBK97_01615, partial [Prevotellaceae bacterium]|nr:hypothetical protein [Prevotellaceae bacterium]